MVSLPARKYWARVHWKPPGMKKPDHQKSRDKIGEN